MAKRITYIRKSINLRQEVCDLIEGECLLRNNGDSGFSLTTNQLMLEYFDMRTPKNIAVKKGADGKAELTIDWDPVRQKAESRRQKAESRRP